MSKTESSNSWESMKKGSQHLKDFTYHFASCSSLVHEEKRTQNKRNSHHSWLDMLYESETNSIDNSPLPTVKTITASDDDRTCYSSKTVKIRNTSNEMMVPNGWHCSTESSALFASDPMQNKSHINYGPRSRNRENSVSTHEAKDRANKILCHYLEEWKRTDNDAKELNSIYQELMPIHDITTIIQKARFEAPKTSIQNKKKFSDSENGEEKSYREEMRCEEESVYRDLIKITSSVTNDHLRRTDKTFGQRRVYAESKHDGQRPIGTYEEEGRDCLGTHCSPRRRRMQTIVEPQHSFPRQAYNSQSQNKVKVLCNPFGNYQINERNDEGVGHTSSKESGLLCKASLKAKEKKCRMLLARQISRGSSQSSQRSRNTQRSQNSRNDTEMESINGGSHMNIEKRNQKCRVESANFGINRRKSEKDIHNFTASEVYKSQKSTNGRQSSEEAQSVSSRNHSRQRQKQKQKQKQQQAYHTRRKHNKELHEHKVPVIDKREKGNISTSTSSRTSRANSACHRLYDLSKSKRLEGKMRREEIILRQMNAALGKRGGRR